MGFDVYFRNSPCVGYMAEKDENVSFVKETDNMSGKEECYLRIKDVGEIYLYDDDSKYQRLGCLRYACVQPFDKVAQYLYEHFNVYFFTDDQDQDILHLPDYVLGRDLDILEYGMMVREMLTYFPNCTMLKSEYKHNEEKFNEKMNKYKDMPCHCPFPEPVIEETTEELDRIIADLPF